MKKILPLLILISLASCSSGGRKTASDAGVESQDNYNWVESLDFDKKTETKYNPSNDEVKTTKEDEKKVLVKESLSALSLPRLEEQLKAGNDPLSMIAISCYQGKFEEAFIQVDKVYSQFKNNTSYWNQVGTCFYLKGDYSKAILFYNKSRDLDPKFAPPYNNLGVVYQKQGRFQKALSAYKKAGEISAFAITPAYNLARLYLQFGVVSKAEPMLAGLYKKSTDDAQVASALATLYLIKNDFDNANKIYSTLPKDLIAKPEVGLNYALSLKLGGKADEAKNVLSQVNESNGELRQYATKVEKFVRN